VPPEGVVSEFRAALECAIAGAPPEFRAEFRAELERAIADSKPLDIADCVPGTAAEKARQIKSELDPLNPAHASAHALLRRLVANPKMEAVRRELRIARSKAAASSPPQTAPDAMAGIFFGLIFTHARNAICPDDRFEETQKLELGKSLRRARTAGEGVTRIEFLTFGAGRTAEEAFVRSIAPVMDNLFGGPHWRSFARIVEVVFGPVVNHRRVRTEGEAELIKAREARVDYGVDGLPTKDETVKALTEIVRAGNYRGKLSI
jgi:hypothetical protein